MGARRRDEAEVGDWLEELPEGDPENDRTVPFDDSMLDDLDDLLDAARLVDDDPVPDPSSAPIDDPSTEIDDLETLLPDVTAAIPPPRQSPARLPAIPVLPWSTEAVIAEYGAKVKALLEPSRPQSEWITPRPPALGRVRATILLGSLSVRVDLKVSVGPDSELRVGRDVLAGRVLVAC